ncbi:EAL domain-containing protein [Lichenibacterium dinghuense]|uniref:EAL domain-containing protein n=1 Tax=Lichenibacterium dinghuense TaxID=2895977 RepID=UPI001F46FE7E|nr:EAL domain-containing protein [Lichenibacterium sp. 6Y81]
MDCTLARMPSAADRCSRGFGLAVRLTRTIRGRILVAFLVMAVITGALGLYAVIRIREAGELATRTFDQSLMSVNYARAAAADFTLMQNAFIRCAVETDPAERARLAGIVAEARTSLVEDLSIAGERAQSRRAEEAGNSAKAAVALWDAAREGLASRHGVAESWRAMDGTAAAVNQQIDLLVNYTAGDGFAYRQKARAIVAADIQATLAGTLLALLAAAAVAWLLARRIMGPVAAASSAADDIARGKLDGAIPPGSGDELGALLSAMAVMRDNLRVMMEREVSQRRSAQARLADALESSAEGIIVVDADGLIALANSQVADFLAASPRVLQPGTPVAALAALIEAPSLGRSGTASRLDDEMRLPDGRWLRVSRSATRDGGFVAVLSDVTMLKEQEEKLKATNLSLDAALENMSQGLCLYDGNSRLTVVNRRFAEIYRVDPGAVRPGLAFDDVLRLKIAASGETVEPAEYLLRRREVMRRTGTEVFEETAHGHTIAIVRHPLAGGGWIATYEDVTERRQAERQILFMARHDALTGLPNRMLFGERIDEALKRLGRGEGFAVLCLDLDRFKQVNDTLGHPAGDELLRQVAERLSACVREVDTVGRLGGDEFAIVQCGIAGEADTIALAHRIIAAVDRPVDIDGRQVTVGVSVGIAVAPRDGTSRTKLLKSADAALYRAKGEGRGVWRCFEPEMDARMQARSALELDLQRALAEDQFEVFYQPLFDVARDRIGGFEALLRWRHPVRGMVSPAEFVSVAEEMGLIVPLGEWVLARACAEAAAWPEHLKVAVNVSPAQFRSARLLAATSEALASSGLSSGRLELEITESVLLSDGEATLDILHSLRAAGVRFALDDFGTGYSSLNYLLSFPFDKIKIDRSFIRDLTTRSEAGAIVRAVSQLATDLGMRITAEGVENREQFERLRDDGCDEVQGFYFSRPVPAAEVGGLLRKWDAVAA